MTVTKQPRSLPAVDSRNSENALPFSTCPAQTGNTETAEIIDNLFAIQSGLDDLHTKLLRLNKIFLRNVQKEGEENEN